MNSYFDTHAHLTLCEDFIPIEDHLAEARREGLRRILDPGLHPNDFAGRKKKLASHPEVLLGAALAPHHTADSTDADLKILETILKTEKVAALSEIGLEYFHLKDNHPEQRDIFATQLDMAKRFDLPVFLHIRDAYDDAHAVVQNSGHRRGAVHCFTGNLADAKKFLNEDFFISFSGIVTFKSAHELQEVARSIPLDRILTETDAPYLAPVPMRGKKNISPYVKHTNRFLAELRGIPLETFNAQVWMNAEKLLGLHDQAL
ncbi:MAG: TatD family hydrolase [Spirochaetia bacterium]|nr:TatD family hydrolase [Spirochaetia bacterium]